MNILVTGANGQLGNEMRIIGRESGDRYLFTDVVAPEGVETVILDITDVEAVRSMVREHEIDCIVNCAAYTNVDKAETDVDFCRRLNALAPKNLAQVMKETGGLLVHVSTDYVFGGDPYNVPCREDQKGTPTGVYGMTKLEVYSGDGVQACDTPHGMALFGVRQKLREDDAEPDGYETAAERGVRPGGHSDICLGPGCGHPYGTGGLCAGEGCGRIRQGRYLPFQQRGCVLVV